MMVMKGRAAVMTAAKKDLEIREYPLPKVAPGCMLVRITCCTICGSDLHTWTGRRKSPVPIILGHEIVGHIVELGAGVTMDSGNNPLNVGDRITWTVMDNCGKCYFCREKGLMMKCSHLKKYGHDSCADWPHFVGGFAEYCYITPGTCVIRVPEELTDEEAAPANCALATVVAGWDAIEVRPFESVLIQGAGALGIYAAALAKHYGCRRIIVADVMKHRLNFVKKFGATETIDSNGLSDNDMIGKVKDLTGGFGADVVMELAGFPALLPLGLKCLRAGGRLVEIGNAVAGALFNCDASDIVFKCLTIKGVHNYDTAHLQKAVDFLQMTRNRFPFGQIVGERVSLDEINTGLKIAESSRTIRVAVKP
jgi:putative phosphonate catabolism associated alcohol dehydrogenase